MTKLSIVIIIQRKGKGILKKASGEVYEGLWDKDMRSGLGKASFVNGDVYEGIWMDNMVITKVLLVHQE